MKTYKLTSTRPSMTAMVLQAESQSHDGTFWSLYKDGRLENKPCPKENQLQLWNFNVKRIEKDYEGKRGEKGASYPFEYINVPEFNKDYFKENTEEHRHALKMQNLVSHIANHAMVAVYNFEQGTGNKSQANKSLKPAAITFILEDLSAKEVEEFYGQRAKNKARGVVDEIFESCYESNDKTKLINIGYGVGVNEPFKQNLMQLYLAIIAKIEKNVNQFITFMESKDQQYHIAITKGLTGINEYENPVISKDAEGRMFLGDSYIGRYTPENTISEAVAYLKQNDSLYEYLRMQIKSQANSEETGITQKVREKLNQAINFIETSKEQAKEVPEKEVSTNSQMQDIEKKRKYLVEGTTIWLEKFRKASGDQKLLTKTSLAFESHFLSNVRQDKADYLTTIQDEAKRLGIHIELTKQTQDSAK